MNKQTVSIAIVDDHATMREITSFRLSRLGYNVVMEAENGRKFLDQLNCVTAPDICLMDINMPVLNGFETVHQLKKHWPGIKVIFFSMQNDITYVQKAMKLGADGYVTKDAPVKELDNVLLQLINNQQSSYTA